MQVVLAVESNAKLTFDYVILITLARCVDSGPLSQRAAIAKVRCRKDPHMQNSMRKLKLTLTLVLSPDPNRYRRRCPDPNARIQKFIHYMAIAAICDSGLSPVCLS